MCFVAIVLLGASTTHTHERAVKLCVCMRESEWIFFYKIRGKNFIIQYGDFSFCVYQAVNIRVKKLCFKVSQRELGIIEIFERQQFPSLARALST
jgi:hypothetical protein